MKKYFATHIPEEDENKSDDIIHVKLHLCSRDIKIGDKGLVSKEISHKSTMPILDAYELQALKEYGAYKIIGEISPEATWVREGDEFDEDEVRFRIMNVNFLEEIAIVDNLEQAYEHGYYEAHTDECKIIAEIKGKCGHFH
jgi:hypothetical protein